MSEPARLTVALADRYRFKRELGQVGMATDDGGAAGNPPLVVLENFFEELKAKVPR